ncbi:MAG: 5'-nucleotidase [Gammaproteobacteria bacterium]|nr:5'-nucleotidase [Gammaproteobacteria bacterium]
MMNSPIFCNRTLNLKKIKMIGLDMDHTLVRYHTENFEKLVFEFSIDNLITRLAYPELIKTLSFSFQDAIRGLVIDSQNGNILKLSRFGLIKKCHHGTHLMDHKEQTKFYRSTYVDLNNENYMAVDTAFSIAFCVLYGQLIDLKDKHPDLFPNYHQIAIDTIDAVDYIHGKTDMKNYILKHHQDYIKICPEIVEGIERFMHYGKQFFILTNSDYYYTKKLLNITLEPFLKKGQKITDIFPYIITLANKPRFFYDNPRFLSVNPDTGLMSNLTDKVVPGIYQGGNAKKLTRDLNLQDDEILYIGDHIYGDIVRLKKDCNWRTALVVDELGDEIKHQEAAHPLEIEIIELMKIKEHLENEYAWKITRELAPQNEDSTQDELLQIQNKLQEIDKKLSHLIIEQDKFFNKKWGKIFRAGAEETFFAYQAERYACIYMEKLQDLLNSPPISYFRAYRRTLGHDIKMN